jgi:hypothetical protein
MRIKNFAIFLLSLIYLAKPAKAQDRMAIKSEKIYVNPDYARGGVDTQVYKSITFIPLETTKESLFGKITKMEVSGDFYILLDPSTNAILIFKKDGKFYAKIDGKKMEHGLVNDFTIDQDQKLIIAISLQKMLWYDFQGKVIKQADIPEKPLSFGWLNSSSIAYTPRTYLGNPVNKDSVNYFIKYLENDLLQKKVLPFNVLQYATPVHFMTTDVPQPYHFYNSGIKDELLFTQKYNTDIYELSSSGIQKVYKIVLPQANSLPEDSLARMPSVIGKEIYISKNSKLIYNLRGLYKIGNYLYFETVMKDFTNRYPYMVYNFKTRELICLNKISPAAASYYLPLLSYYGSIVACDGKYVYSTVASLDMFKAKEATADKHPNYPPVLKKYFDMQDRKSNPVIVRLEPLE